MTDITCRAVFQETERLKNRITSLTDRVHELESALGQMHSHITPEGPHPLLSADLLALSREAEDNEKEQVAKRQGPGFGHEGDNAGKADEDVPESGKEDEVTEIKEGLGTLTLHSDGRSRFYGPTAGIEVSPHYGFMRFVVKVTDLYRLSCVIILEPVSCKLMSAIGSHTFSDCCDIRATSTTMTRRRHLHVVSFQAPLARVRPRGLKRTIRSQASPRFSTARLLEAP